MKRSIVHTTRCMLLLVAILLTQASCDVHEFPAPRGTVAVQVHLEHSTKMCLWENGVVTDTVNMVQTKGTIRHTVRVYSGFATRRQASFIIQEHTFTRNVSEGYDYSFPLEIPEGDYTIMVWSELIEPESKDNSSRPFYNIDDFSAISYADDYRGNTDYRDAFRGIGEVSLKSSTHVMEAVDCHIKMERPLAKYEIIATDFRQFLTKEILKQAASVPSNANINELITRVSLNDYRAEIAYSGFMPCEYNMTIDKPVDSKRGVKFDSRIMHAEGEEASICFDYVMVNGTSASVSIQLSVYDPYGERISQTSAITVPLKRNHHTIMRGAYLMQQASGGIEIQPEFDGDHNIIIP